MGSNKLFITPKTKVLQLIEEYPQLEDILIDYVPSFRKLKNPILRKTVARITTLHQAAAIGNVNIQDLINKLRKAVGQDLISISNESNYVFEQPVWFDKNMIIKELDIRELLAAGDHPVNQLIADFNKLKENEIYKVLAPFLPAPLIDKSKSLNIDHWIIKENEELFCVYFSKRSHRTQF